MKKGQISALLIAQHKPDGSIKPEEPANEGLKEALFDLWKACKSEQWDLAAKAFEEAFDICESKEDEEDEEEED